MRTARLTPLLLLALVACGGGDEKKDDSPSSGREITVAANDALRFDPATITAEPGETITFVVTNTGTIDHEFMIGDEEYQSGHGGGDGHGDHAHGEGAGSHVKPGETVRVTYTMPDQPPTYVCHVDDHDAAGMKGTIAYG
jgi:plastocyanin